MLKTEELITIKSLDKKTSHLTIRIPNWILKIIETDIESNDFQVEAITNRTEAIVNRLEESMVIEARVIRNWIKLNNMDMRKQIGYLKSLVSEGDIQDALNEKGLLPIYKNPKTTDNIIKVVQYLKKHFSEELNSSFINAQL